MKLDLGGILGLVAIALSIAAMAVTFTKEERVTEVSGKKLTTAIELLTDTVRETEKEFGEKQQ